MEESTTSVSHAQWLKVEGRSEYLMLKESPFSFRQLVACGVVVGLFRGRVIRTSVTTEVGNYPCLGRPQGDTAEEWRAVNSCSPASATKNDRHGGWLSVGLPERP